MVDHIVGSLLFLLNLTGSIRGESTPSAVATTSALVRQNDMTALEKKFMAIQLHTLTNMEVKRASFAASLSSVADEKKRLRIETVLGRLNEINTLQTTLFMNILKRLQTGLNEVQTKADAYGKETGKDLSKVYQAIDLANTALADAVTAVTVQAEQVYTLTVTTAGSVRESYGKERSKLASDLKKVRDTVQNARKKVGEALKAYRAASGKTDKIIVPTASSSAAQS